MGTESTAFDSVADLGRWCRAAPAGTRLDAQVVAEVLDAAADRGPEEDIKLDTEPVEWTWREKLWTCPAETRIGTLEVAEALGRPRSWVYARTHHHVGKDDQKRLRPQGELIPHRKLDGVLVFTAGEVRSWIRTREEVVAAGPMESTPAEREGKLHAV